MNYTAQKGNLTRDPELKYLPSGAAVCELNIAVNEVWYNDAKEKQERVHFLGCIAYGKLGENIAKFFGKGMPILVEGSLTQESWEDKETGKKREKTRIKVSGFDFCGGEKKPAANTASGQPAASRPAPRDPDLDGDPSDIPF